MRVTQLFGSANTNVVDIFVMFCGLFGKRTTHRCIVIIVGRVFHRHELCSISKQYIRNVRARTIDINIMARICRCMLCVYAENAVIDYDLCPSEDKECGVGVPYELYAHECGLRDISKCTHLSVRHARSETFTCFVAFVSHMNGICQIGHVLPRCHGIASI